MTNNPLKTTPQWVEILRACGCTQTNALKWAPVFADEIRENTFNLGVEELDDFLGQILHESGMLSRVEENLRYTTPQRIQAVWPSRFPTVESALPYVRNPEGLANLVYGSRMGNTSPGDGWKYRGRGLLQVTGKDNYTAVGKSLSLPLVDSPDLLLEPQIALRASIAWWEGNIPDSAVNCIRTVTRRVNGGTTGLAHRTEVTLKAEEIINKHS